MLIQRMDYITSAPNKREVFPDGRSLFFASPFFFSCFTSDPQHSVLNTKCGQQGVHTSAFRVSSHEPQLEKLSATAIGQRQPSTQHKEPEHPLRTPYVPGT